MLKGCPSWKCPWYGHSNWAKGGEGPIGLVGPISQPRGTIDTTSLTLGHTYGFPLHAPHVHSIEQKLGVSISITRTHTVSWYQHLPKYLIPMGSCLCTTPTFFKQQFNDILVRFWIEASNVQGSFIVQIGIVHKFLIIIWTQTYEQKKQSLGQQRNDINKVDLPCSKSSRTQLSCPLRTA